ncbi:MAG TPA: anaerobic glycerol-3-phosphate dehydrogenase subunit B [Aggregatilineales bacterium]|nr:anaerobic glycerol-3-phosphate dehydrogenase subunit B [Anaerolineales bacterium]HRE46087.1 anaerobic glycerol-3-phosphate dehydrogenase subunit B [Aggregatilineales bacterium]
MDDVIIVGAGWAGLAAALFALEQGKARGAKIRLIAQGIGSPIVTPGWISLLDAANGDVRRGLVDLVRAHPNHPYALVGAEVIMKAVESFLAISAAIGLPYTGERVGNRTLRTALGGVATPALVPPGYAASMGDTPLFVGFAGWRDYYPALSGNAVYVTLPNQDRLWDAPPTEIAREFDAAAVRQAAAEQIKGHLKGISAVGFPAVLGLADPQAAIADLTALLGVPVFEVPTLPPSVPGTRLYNAIRRYLLDHKVRMQVGHPVGRGLIEQGRVVGVEVEAVGKPQPFRARAVILATGNLYGGGLFSDDRGHIWEGIFNLPVQYPKDRSGWFAETMLAAGGHPIHHVGIRVDEAMQPLDEAGEPFAEGLYAAGHLIAHPSGAPSPLETSEGVALATAYKAVQSALA